MVSIERSVRNPSRPWLIPTSGTSKGANRRAILSIVPSPPRTIAKSTFTPISSKVSIGYFFSGIFDAVRLSNTTIRLRLSKNFPRRRSGAIISGFLYLPIRAIVLNKEFITKLNTNQP